MEMKRLLWIVTLIFFVSNAIFWGLYSHETHCNFIDYNNKVFKTSTDCPSHKIHLLWGFVCYSISVYISQSNLI